MRGTANEVTTSTTTDRITPACAGNSCPASRPASYAKDHPRVCGEQVIHSLLPASSWGSPPRVRGTVRQWTLSAWAWRITPACAGNSLHGKSGRKGKPDHPRVCGEQWIFIDRCCPQWGSPPRVRGTVLIFRAFSVLLRITPACAGNRLPPQSRHFANRDHPRVCGEQKQERRPSMITVGSPPRVRGTAWNPE